MINVGGQTLGTALMPLTGLISHIFGMKAPENTSNIGAVQGQSLAAIGTEMALIFALGFVVNLLMARFTPLKYVHLSPHVSFFFAGLIASLLKYNTSLSMAAQVGVGAIILGLYMTITCWYVAICIKPVRGAKGFTLAHSSSSGDLIASIEGELFGNKSKSIEDLKIPAKYGFLREMTIALTLVMTLLFFFLGLFAGPTWTMTHVAGGKDIVLYAITQGVQFGMWITIIITGVRMMLSELIPAFHGIAKKLIPNATPGLDVHCCFLSTRWRSLSVSYAVWRVADRDGAAGSVSFSNRCLPGPHSDVLYRRGHCDFRRRPRWSPRCHHRQPHERLPAHFRSGLSAWHGRHLRADHADPE